MAHTPDAEQEVMPTTDLRFDDRDASLSKNEAWLAFEDRTALDAISDARVREQYSVQMDVLKDKLASNRTDNYRRVVYSLLIFGDRQVSYSDLCDDADMAHRSAQRVVSFLEDLDLLDVTETSKKFVQFTGGEARRAAYLAVKDFKKRQAFEESGDLPTTPEEDLQEADAVLNKNCDLSEVTDAIDSAVNGDLSPDVYAKLEETVLANADVDGSPDADASTDDRDDEPTDDDRTATDDADDSPTDDVPMYGGELVVEGESQAGFTTASDYDDETKEEMRQVQEQELEDGTVTFECAEDAANAAHGE